MRNWWKVWFAKGRGVEASDPVIIENFDPNYLLFEETAKVLKADQSSRVFIPVRINSMGSGPNRVNQEFVEVMCSISRIDKYKLIPIAEIEPIRLNAARQVREQLRGLGIKSIVVISPGFCSRRSLLVYQSVFDPGEVEISCLPVFGDRDPSNWTESWHGIQEVFLEFGKLWYYRLWVLG